MTDSLRIPADYPKVAFPHILFLMVWEGFRAQIMMVCETAAGVMQI